MMIFVFKVDRQIKLKAKIIKGKNIFCAEFIKNYGEKNEQ